MSASSRAIDESLFDWPSANPALKASRCRHCHAVAFPRSDVCQHCTGSAIDAIELPRDGHIWSWTTQAFPPASPPYLAEPFEPFFLGYVELGGEIVVESRLSGYDADRQPAIGDAVQLVIESLGRDDAGTTIVTYAFKASA